MRWVPLASRVWALFYALYLSWYGKSIKNECRVQHRVALDPDSASDVHVFSCIRNLNTASFRAFAVFSISQIDLAYFAFSRLHEYVTFKRSQCLLRSLQYWLLII